MKSFEVTYSPEDGVVKNRGFFNIIKALDFAHSNFHGFECEAFDLLFFDERSCTRLAFIDEVRDILIYWDKE